MWSRLPENAQSKDAKTPLRLEAGAKSTTVDGNGMETPSMLAQSSRIQETHAVSKAASVPIRREAGAITITENGYSLATLGAMCLRQDRRKSTRTRENPSPQKLNGAANALSG